MRHWIWLVTLIALLQGCAMQLDIRAGSGSDDSENVSMHPVLLIQHSSIAPKGDDALLSQEDLRPGDIILTSAPSLTSASIQLMTWAPVSHAAVYIGNDQVVDAVHPGVRVSSMREVLAEADMALAFRYPGLNAEQARDIRAFMLEKVGTQFNYLGVTLHMPFAIERKLCELPLVPSDIRDLCIRIIGGIQHLASSERAFFCSQLVLQAYRHAGVPITDADPRLISPADILHMREGDVSSVRIHNQLRRVGHLKYPPPVTVALEQ